MAPFFVSPAAAIDRAAPSPLPVGRVYASHPLPPPVRLVRIESVPFPYGRGKYIYSLIPKGETFVSPFVNPL